MNRRSQLCLSRILVLVTVLAGATVSAHDDHSHTHKPHTQKAPSQKAHAQKSIAAQGHFQLDNRGFDALPLSHHQFKNNPENFQFVIMSDRTGGHRTPVFLQAIRKVNLMQPEFVVSVGDMIEGYTADKKILNQQWDDFNRMIDKLESPYFYTPGNHDFSNDVMAQVWQERYGADYYHVVYKDVLFLMLNTEAGLAGIKNPELDAAQYAYAAKVLEDNPDVRWTLVFMHQPLWKFKNTPNWDKLQAQLTQRKYTAFAGHMHSYDYHTAESGQEQITLGSTGGVSLLRGTTYGEFDHVTWVTINDQGPVIANLTLDGIQDKYITDPEFDKIFDREEVFHYGAWYQDQGTLSEERVHSYDIAVSNPFPKQLNYTISFESNPYIQVKNQTLTGTLAPGERVTRQALLSLAGVEDIDLLQPLVFKASASYQIDPLKTADWDKTVRIHPVARNTVAAAKAPMTFDGNLGEWESLRYAFGGTEGSDGHVRFDTRFDEDYLYIAFDVTDDEVTNAKPLGFDGSTDLASIMIDGRPSHLSASQTGNTKALKKGEWMFAGVAPDGQQGNIIYPDLMPQGFTGRTALREGGYTSEIRVPISFLDKSYGASWQDFRINVSLIDSDPHAKRVKNYDWQPNWENNVEGTGLFFRQ